ncbi:tRNA (guanine-N7-)-methyltransferase [Virgibacillus natechei]|uniref:tRNA (guanine-N(7)-)-methyltransferase n=1 Tax=Virgibacillus natechei TaxID=1216297 RepID=A0ABS4IDK3_9BACI|nr:tRNA (guanosine(46)-N7)-methyltransferase TrmB [Virgibacillus natechei]MBP1968933.1 tRNA (guanine-N7-)-methyltransferase [Virgibacillus natechei]UZD11724.1 tRNA (guanosine(46)-N7)-methyltransferase TrmB [Virgibacillus natechei]
MRQRYKPWADDFLENNNHIVLGSPYENKGDWKSIFGNDNPVHIEIGTGKGQFIVGMAKQFPNINFVGIELEKSVIVTAAQKVLDSGLDNIALLNENAENIQEIFADNEVATIYLNFSDPWPKNRHEKRRLTFHTFLKQYQAILEPTGEIVFKTDNKGLFEYSLVSFSKFGLIVEEVRLDLHEYEDPLNVMTEYEEKFSAKGQPIYRCRASFSMERDEGN